VLELHQKISSAYYSGRLYRMMGNASRCHVGCFLSNREDWMAAEAQAEFQEFLKAHPYSAYASVLPVHETYEIILIS
jgi:outer membrane protein assembly factor BamD (BamD/ComL family)